MHFDHQQTGNLSGLLCLAQCGYDYYTVGKEAGLAAHPGIDPSYDLDGNESGKLNA